MNRTSRFEYSTVRWRFDSGGTDCVGRLYRPDRSRNPPVTVLAPGPGVAWTGDQAALAEQLAAAGVAAFAFDPRGTGESDGTPRDLIAPRRLAADIDAAIDTVRDAGEVDGDTVALWGVNLTAGAALAAAADDLAVDAVVARAPVATPRRLLRDRGWRLTARAAATGLVDRLLRPLGRERSVPVAGTPASLAPFGEPGLVQALADGDAATETPARSLLSVLRAGADEGAASATGPCLLVAGTRDAVAPPERVAALCEELANATLLRVPGDHGDLLAGAAADRATTHEVTFLRAELRDGV